MTTLTNTNNKSIKGGRSMPVYEELEFLYDNTLPGSLKDEYGEELLDFTFDDEDLEFSDFEDMKFN